MLLATYRKALLIIEGYLLGINYFSAKLISGVADDPLGQWY